MISIFLTGATGYIGGCVLDLLNKKKDSCGYKLTAMARTKENAQILESAGVNVVMGDLDDSEVISNEAYNSDVVIEFANCDHLGIAQAIADGLKRRLKDTGKKGIYIQTSGAGILSNARAGKPGELPFGDVNPEIYSDKETERLNALPESQPHRHVDNYLIKDSEGNYDLIIIAPPSVYGSAHGPFAHRRSIQFPLIAQTTLRRGRGQMIGKGTNTWSYIHVADLAQLYIVALDLMVAGKLKTLGREGYFLPEAGEFTFGDIAKSVAKIYHSWGVISTDEVDIVNSTEGVAEVYGYPRALYYVGSNGRCRGDKCREIGWKPERSGDDLQKSLENECRLILEESNKGGFMHERWELKKGRNA